MPERFCPNCRERVDDSRYCADCGERLSDTESDEDTGDQPPSDQNATALPPPPPPEDETDPVRRHSPIAEETQSARAAEEPPQAPEVPADHYPGLSPEAEVEVEEMAVGDLPDESVAAGREPGAIPADGQLRCAHCGESAYRDEVLCWACRRRLEEPSALPDVAPQHEGPVAEPASGARTETPPAPTGGAQLPAAGRTQTAAGAAPSGEAITYAWWSFGLGLISVFTCGALGLLGVAAVWMGVLGMRRDAGPMAVAGIALGALGILMLLALVIAAALMLRGSAGAPPDFVSLPTGIFGGVL